MVSTESKQKKIDGLFWTALKRTWCTFCTKTSIHGLKFTNDPSANRIIKFLWWIITLTCFICSITMVIDFYSDYRRSPTRMNIESDHTPVSSLYFPSVTICPAVLFNTEKSERYIQKLKLPPFTNASIIVEKLTITNGFMDDEEENLNDNNIELMEQLLQLNNLSIDKFFKDLRWDCSDLLFRCRYQFKILPCDKLFQVANTFLGYCCSFNLNQTGINFTDFRASAGLREGLSIILYQNDSSIKRNPAYARGFKVLIDEVSIFPSAQSVVKFIPSGEEVFAAIRPVETFCSKSVEALPIEERQCTFPNEMSLKYFSLFTGPHCELDCRIASTLKICGCIPYYISNDRSNDTTCSFKDIPCLVKNFAFLIGRFRKSQCACSNECEMIDYDMQITNTDLQINIPTVDPFYNDLQMDYSVLHIFLNSQVYRRIRRDLLSSTVTLVSNLGSAFSLFVGMSMVSLVEIFYYFTVVLHKNYVQEARARKEILFERKTQN